jgi:hypothetical protein
MRTVKLPVKDEQVAVLRGGSGYWLTVVEIVSTNVGERPVAKLYDPSIKQTFTAPIQPNGATGTYVCNPKELVVVDA